MENRPYHYTVDKNRAISKLAELSRHQDKEIPTDTPKPAVKSSSKPTVKSYSFDRESNTIRIQVEL